MKKFLSASRAATRTGLLLVSLITLAAGSALASDHHSPRTAGLGGAGHAGPLLNDSIVLNPSYASFLPTYSVALNYLTFSGGQYNTPQGVVEPHGRNYSVSLLDGRSSLFQAGVTYTQREGLSVLNIGASRSVVKRLGFGLGGKFLFDHARDRSMQDMTFSVTGIPSSSFQTAFIIDNLLETQVGKDRGMYREYILGTKINIVAILLFYVDPHYVPSLPSGEAWGYEAGAELALFADLFLRAGMFRNSYIPFLNERGRGFSMGAGWIGPRLALDYALERAVSPIGTTAHTFGATLYF